MTRVLNRKLLRDLWRTRSQGLAIALVVACAVATVVMAANTRRTLHESLAAYYASHAFADVFATAVRAPESLVPALRSLPDVVAVETRIATWAMLFPPEMLEPAVARILSLPDGRTGTVNRIALRAGRPVVPGHPHEAVVSESFATAHGLAPGDALAARIGEEVRALTVVGVALAPEAVFSVGPGQIVPDDRRFGHLWMSRQALAEALGYEDVFNEVLLRVGPGAEEERVRRQLDALLASHGGTTSHGRAAHPSHAFVQGQLEQIAGLAIVLPPMFLLVGGFLLYGALSRIIVVERPQIGILKSLGVDARTIRRHYVQYAGAIMALGALLGVLLGAWMGLELTRLYARYFRFPSLLYTTDIAALLAALAVVAFVTCASAAHAVRRVLRLAPAAALQPASPLAYGPAARMRVPGALPRMLIRQLLRHRGRAALAGGAAALAMGLIIATAFSFDALEHMIRVTAASERQDAVVLAPFAVPEDALVRLREMPAVRHAEGFRVVYAELAAGDLRQPVPLTGSPVDGQLRQLLGPGYRPLPPPARGIVLSTKLAELLRVQSGDEVQLWLPRARVPLALTVTGLARQYFGIEATVALPMLNEWLGEGQRYNGARIALDPGEKRAFLQALRDVPALAAYIDTRATLETFRTTMQRTLVVLVSFFVLFALLTTLGVVYSNARILFAERRQDLAVLRALGYPARNVALLLLAELVMPAVLAAPLGWCLGRLFGWLIVLGLDGPLFRVPLVIAPRTDMAAILVTLLATLAAGLLVARAAARLRLAPALAARE